MTPTQRSDYYAAQTYRVAEAAERGQFLTLIDGELHLWRVGRPGPVAMADDRLCVGEYVSDSDPALLRQGGFAVAPSIYPFNNLHL